MSKKFPKCGAARGQLDCRQIIYVSDSNTTANPHPPLSSFFLPAIYFRVLFYIKNWRGGISFTSYSHASPFPLSVLCIFFFFIFKTLTYFLFFLFILFLSHENYLVRIDYKKIKEKKNIFFILLSFSVFFNKIHNSYKNNFWGLVGQRKIFIQNLIILKNNFWGIVGQRKILIQNLFLANWTLLRTFNIAREYCRRENSTYKVIARTLNKQEAIEKKPNSPKVEKRSRYRQNSYTVIPARAHIHIALIRL